MAYRRILTIQDISCVGQCSMTIAMPVLSACGHETCILPTAVLSTHTGGFGPPAVIHFGEELSAFWKHWQKNGISFDAILVGYLGSVDAIHMTMDVIDHLLSPQGIAIVDPVMADHGKLYSGFDEDYVQEMKALCRKAHILLPNMTEAAMLSGMPYRETPEEADILRLLQNLDHPCAILTGVGCEPGQIGAALWQKETIKYHFRERLGGSFHGTGDLFAACFTGALMQPGTDAFEAMAFAVDATQKVIGNTLCDPAHWYGIKFETILPELSAMMTRREG